MEQYSGRQITLKRCVIEKWLIWNKNRKSCTIFDETPMKMSVALSCITDDDRHDGGGGGGGGDSSCTNCGTSGAADLCDRCRDLPHCKRCRRHLPQHCFSGGQYICEVFCQTFNVSFILYHIFSLCQLITYVALISIPTHDIDIANLSICLSVHKVVVFYQNGFNILS